MKRKGLLVFILFLLLNNTGNAQNFGKNIRPDDSHKPNTNSGIIGDDLVNVDLYTGIGSVKIPFYEYTIDGLNLGVSLSYNAKGIKVDEISSSVGLGWNLNAGGYVTREVKGLEDEVTLPTAISTLPGDSLQGYMVPGARVEPLVIAAPWDDQEHDLFGFNMCGRSLDVSFIHQASGFNYNTSPSSEVKIDVITKDVDIYYIGGGIQYINLRSGFQKGSSVDKFSNISTFTVTDEQGNVFLYDRGDYQFKKFKFDHGDYTVDSGIYYPTQKWNLVKIITNTGKIITYEYDVKYVKYIENRTEELLPKDAERTYNYDSSKWFLTYDPLVIKDNVWEGYKTHLKKINYPNGVTVDFELDTARCDCRGDFRVKNILITGRIKTTISNIKKYVLHTAYFNTAKYGYSQTQISESPCSYIKSLLSTANAAQQEEHLDKGIRLKLLDIQRQITTGGQAYTEPYYAFEYDTTQLPYRMAPSQDYYGYYNGKTPVKHIRSRVDGSSIKDTFYLSIPYPASPENSYGSIITVDSISHSVLFGLNRDADINFTKAGILKKITNGKGGELLLSYIAPILTNPTCSYGYIHELNRDEDEFPEVPIDCNIDGALQGATCPDGLCVNIVTYSDLFNAQSTGSTTNTSSDEYIYSSGQRFHRGGYFWYNDLYVNKPVYTNYFVGAHNYVNGSNHGFSQVEVKRKGFNSKVLSSMKYAYSNLMYLDQSGNTQSWIRKPTGLTWHTMPADMKKYRLGLLQSKASYDENGILTSKTNYTYEYVLNKIYDYWPDSVRSMKYFKTFSWHYLIMDNQHARVVKEIDSNFIKDPSTGLTDILVKTVDYKYNEIDNLIAKSTKDSKGDVYKVYYYLMGDIYRSGSHVYDFLDYIQAKKFQYEYASKTWKMVSADSVLINANAISARYLSSGSTIFDNTFRVNGSYDTHIQAPLTSSVVGDSVSNLVGIKSAFFNSVLPAGSHLIKEKTYTLFDDQGLVLESYDEIDKKYSSFLFDTISSNLIAEVFNAKNADIAYSSFEGAYQNNSKVITTGNFSFKNSLINTTNAFTGKNSIVLGSNDSICSQALSKYRYNFTFWCKSTTAPPIFIQRGSSNISVSSTLRNTVGLWKLYSATFDAIANDRIKVKGLGTGGGAIVDEIRVYPYDARMLTYTLEPLFGISSKTDENNYTLYYDYNVFGRLNHIRDMRGNIISKVETAYDDADLGTSNPNEPTTPTPPNY
jgi:hypothetical protein